MPSAHGADVLPFLKSLPLAPEYHPTAAEFQDPIAYILKIEPEASRFGICKIVPPLPAASKKSTLSHLSHSFSLRSPDHSPTFTTRQQQIGFCPRRPRPVQKPVWQSGDRYTLPHFQTKANHFHRLQLHQAAKKSLSPLETETLFWRACAGRPFSVEYANDMPGSGFPQIDAQACNEARNVGESGWNMRAVSRARCSLLRFMKGEVPGVTSPMVYVGMMFSWFAWHVEDHDLHSLNYLHMGAGKTWYGVPRDAGLAFEDVIRVQGYGGEVNPLVTFAILGEKTTVISPEVLIDAGIPCCRLVQNAGEFVVTFPGSYHSGFNHGFNCAEASNIATPKWLNVAKEAAVKRASTNYPPMVSHYQLLYALALSLCSRMPKDDLNEPRSSRLKCKMKGEGEAMVKGFFIENVIQNNNLLSVLLEKGSPCIVLPHNTPSNDFSSSTHARSHMTIKPRLSLGLCTREEALKASEVLYSNNVIQKCNGRIRQLGEYYPMEENPILVCHEKKLISAKCSKYGNSNLHPSTSNTESMENEKRSTLHGDGLLDKGLLSCVTCGILSFSCVAVIQPREAASRYLMSADCDLFNDPIIDSGEISDFRNDSNLKIRNEDMVSAPGHVETHVWNASHGNLADCKRQSMEASTQNVRMVSDSATQKGISALDLLASAYGDCSDSEELDKMPACSDESYSRDSAQSGQPKTGLTCPISLPNICSSNTVSRDPSLHSVGVDCQNVVTKTPWIPSEIVSSSAVPTKISCLLDVAANLTDLANISAEENHKLNMEFVAQNLPGDPESVMENNFDGGMKLGLSSCLTQSTKGRYFFDGTGESDSSYSTEASDTSETKMPNPVSGSADVLVSSASCCDSDPPTGISASVMKENHFDTSLQNSGISLLQRSQKDSSRMHVFCLEHAVEVERQLHRIGGVHIMLVCHPEYPKIEAEAKVLAKELGMDHCWKDISYQEAAEEDQRMIRSALEDEKTIPMKGDWAVKLGINLYYSASLGKSPLYCKQLPYNLVIYKAFGRNSTGIFPGKPRGLSRRPGRKRRIVVAGRWCGKVWMSNQVHPYLADRKDIHNYDLEQEIDQNLLAETEIEETDLVSSPRGNLSNNAEATRKSGRKRKRKKALLKLSNKRSKSADLYNSDCSEDVYECSSAQVGRVLHSSSSKQTAGRNSAREKASRPASRKQVVSKKTKKVQAKASTSEDEEAEYPCDVEGCLMRFGSRQDLVLHRRNICPVEGCGKKLFSHKYLVQHQKVHIDDRPLKCPWKGCSMAFKWPWARTEHIRVHTGDRPYVCEEPGCDQTFRFVSDFSRHKRKTGHSTKRGKRLMTNLRCQLRMS